MEFGLLGPLDVRSNGTQLGISPGMQRALLAALLLQAGRVLPVSGLIATLWGAGPPASAQACLQNYVKRLRQALGDEQHDLIQTVAPGYLIAVGPADLDVTVFEGLLQAGRSAARARAWPEAADRLRAALALWRGRPLADVPHSELVQQEARRLGDQRLLAVETRVSADLHLGRHAAVIPELRQLTARHPLRERPHGLLMLALWLDGQRGPALATYQRAHAIILRELGIEPGRELRDLNELMTARDSRPDARPGRPADGQPDLVRTWLELASADACLPWPA
jgi:DNA-binding SARP family transcriptional activator